MIIVISNREVNEEYSNENLFGDRQNTKGLDKIRLAKANFDEAKNRWSLELIPEEENLNESNLPSQKLFQEIVNGIAARIYKPNWVFYITGFNQSCRKSLDTSWQFAQKYDVDVITFSWLSNPGGPLIPEYEKAQKAAQASAKALAQILEKLDWYMKNCLLDRTERRKVSFNLLVHSLGNFIVESYARLPVSSQVGSIFDNVIFHQADVESKTHTEWIDRITIGQRLYVTINRDDDVLSASGSFRLVGFNNTTISNRLGNTTKGLTAAKPIYIDFTRGRFVGQAHNLFLSVDNSIIETFFKQLFRGKQGEKNNRPFRFDDELNAYVFDQDYTD
ncbi:MAG: alpha/beta hydrolase [Symploca sp. SIO2E9]|nr:alpha/beta hydrolase [Symploca sp. SIO2E9]